MSFLTRNQLLRGNWPTFSHEEFRFSRGPREFAHEGFEREPHEESAFTRKLAHFLPHEVMRNPEYSCNSS